MLLFSPLFAGIFLVVGLGFLLIRALTSPLNKIPGPYHARLTSLIMKWHEMTASRTMYVHHLHLKYGPTVRVAPNEVVFASQGAIKEIYGSGGSGYDKTEFYDLFTPYGRRTMFTVLNKNDHARRKRVIADRYANTNVVRESSIGGIAERATRFVEKCYESTGNGLDIYINLHAYAFDCVTHHLFHPYGSDSLRKKQDEYVMREVAFDDSLQNRLIRYYSPTLYRIIGGILSLFAKPRETPLADEFVLDSTAKTDAAPFTLLSRLHEKGAGMTESDPLDIAAECLDHMAAGIDTTGDALCFLMWELSQPTSAHIQRRLQAELRENPRASFDQLPFLDAVMNEGLRCWPAIPMSLPRYVPPGGRTIEGYFVPASTIVSCQAYSTHRIDSKVFPEPEKFDPDRWLEEDGEVERKRLFFAFASGGRGCVGRHLALAEMKLLLREVYSRFNTYADSATTAEHMVMSDQLISSRPVGQQCFLKFVPIEDTARA